MLILLIICILLLISLLIYTIILLRKYIDVNEKLNVRDLFLKKATNVINSVRYGNIYERLEETGNKDTKEMAKLLNELFESITDREKMVRENIEKEHEIKVLKNDFMATLTHDLKVPIIAQDNTFDLLLSKKFGEISQVQEEVIKKLKTSNMDLKYLVDTLLETFKIEQTNLEIKRESVVLDDFIKDIISQLDCVYSMHDKNINFKNELPKDTTANIDNFLIKRVMQNLILNAISHSGHSKEIDITLKKNDKNSFKISVQDYGFGIDKKEVEKIFKKYYSSSTKFSRSGVGLGLYLCNKVVKLHGGKIEVTSKENKGSKFTVILNYEE